MVLLSENHHKSILLWVRIFCSIKVLSPFVDHFLHHLIEKINPRLAIAIGQVDACLKEFLHPSYTIVMNGRSGATIHPQYLLTIESKETYNTYVVLTLYTYQG